MWQARGAREQQSLRIWIGSFFFGVDGIQLAHSVGEWSFLPFDLVRYSCLPSDKLGEWRMLAGHLPCLM